MKWLQRWWWARQRKTDIQVLWPAVKAQARSVDHAREAFMIYAIGEPSWVRHYGEKLYEAVKALR